MEVPNAFYFADHHIVDVPGLGHLEAYPNRDSVQYKEIYKLKAIKTLYRGTFRNLGWCDLFLKLVQLDMFRMDDEDFTGMTYRDYMCSLMGCKETVFRGRRPQGPRGKAATSPPPSTRSSTKWLGWASSTTRRRPRQDHPPRPPAWLAAAETRLKPVDRDMCVMHHEFIAEYPKTKKREKITSTLLAFGDPNGDTSMAKTVSLPAAIATRLMLKGKIKKTGVHIPVDPLIYEPVLREMNKQVGLKFVEKTTKL